MSSWFTSGRLAAPVLGLLAAWGCASGAGSRGAAPSPEVMLALQESRTYINPGTMVRPEGISQAVQMGRMVWITGQVALDNRGEIVGRDLRAQAAQAFRNLGTVLEIARATPRDLVKLTVYVVGYQPGDLAVLREAAPQYFPRLDAPATTVLGVGSLHMDGLVIAVEGVAMLRPAVPDSLAVRRPGRT